VLEPVNAAPVVIEDDVLVGGNCGVDGAHGVCGTIGGRAYAQMGEELDVAVGALQRRDHGPHHGRSLCLDG